MNNIIMLYKCSDYVKYAVIMFLMQIKPKFENDHVAF